MLLLPPTLRKVYALVASVGLSLVVLSPMREPLKPPGEARVDSFPLSYYPMFSRPRPALETATYVVALEPDGTRHTVPYRMWAVGGWNQGRAQIHRYKNGNAGGFDALCALLVEKMAASTRDWKSRVSEVRIVKGWYDRDVYFGQGDTRPQKEQVYKSCTVPGRAR